MKKTKNIYRDSISELHGNLVVSYDEGDRLGNVSDVYFDKQSCRIKGISLSSKFLGPDDKNFVKFKEIRRLGNSVVIISNQDALEKLPDGLEANSLRMLKGIRIVTQNGEHLGEMLDANVVAETGVIQDIILYGKKKIRIDVEKDKIRIGPDMIVVPAAYKANISANEKEHEDALSNVVKTAGEVTRKFADSFNVAVQKVTAASKPAPGSAESKRDDRSKKESGKKNDATGKPVVEPAKEIQKKAPAKQGPTGINEGPAKKATPAKKKVAVKKKAPAK